MTTEQELQLANTLIAAATPLIAGIFKAHPDKAAAKQTLIDLIARAAAAPAELAEAEAEHDKAADVALDVKFPTGDGTEGK